MTLWMLFFVLMPVAAVAVAYAETSRIAFMALVVCGIAGLVILTLIITGVKLP